MKRADKNVPGKTKPARKARSSNAKDITLELDHGKPDRKLTVTEIVRVISNILGAASNR